MSYVNLFNNVGVNPYNTSAYSAFQSRAFGATSLNSPFASLFSGNTNTSNSILPFLFRQSATGQSAPAASGDSSNLLMMMLMQMLAGKRSQSILKQVSVSPPELKSPVADKTSAEISKLKADADATVKGLKFTADELKSIVGKERNQIYADTVTKAFGLSWVKGNPKFLSGVFAGSNNNGITTQNLIDKNLLSKEDDWNLADLQSTFGQNGANLKDLNSTVNANSAFHSQPFHLGQAQKLLNKSRAITEYLSQYQVSDSELETQAKELKDLAKLYYDVAGATESPIIFDADGSGKIELTSVKDGVQFDIDGDGKKDQVAWTQAKGDKTDAWLTLDRNGNGQIDSGKELFGNQHGQANGYEELKKFDDNQDGVIDAKDAVYAKLKTWKDVNHDGISQANEMQDLKTAGVESVKIGYAESSEKDAFGNELRQQSDFTRTDEAAAKLARELGKSAASLKTGLSVDAWLQTLKSA